MAPLAAANDNEKAFEEVAFFALDEDEVPSY